MVELAIGEALVTLRARIGQMTVVPSLPSGRVPSLPPDDDDEDGPEGEDRMADRAPPDAPPPSLALFLVYVNAKGEGSQRRVSIRRLVGNPPTNLMAWCHERKAMRNFRIDRISEAVDPATGEVLVGAAIVELILDAGFTPLDPRLRRAAEVLVFLMRCDGLAHPAEWTAIDDSLDRYCLRFGGDDDALAGAKLLARRIAPDSDDFLRGMRAFAADDRAAAIARWLRQALTDVADADGRHSPEEFAWLMEVQSLLARMGAS